MNEIQTKSDYSEVQREYMSVNEAYNNAKSEFLRMEQDQRRILSELNKALKQSEETVRGLRAQREDILYHLNQYRLRHK